MQTNLTNSILRRRKSVDDVLGLFHKTIGDLDRVATEQAAEAERQAQLAADAEAARQAADTEATRAREVATKIKTLLTQ